MKTIYYDTLFHGLIPVKVLAWKHNDNTIQIKRKRGSYKIGEIITGICDDNLVIKTRVISHYQYCKTASPNLKS
jgi:hypothetical protein